MKGDIRALLLELDPTKTYIVVAKRGSFDPRDFVIPLDSNYKKAIPLVIVDEMDDFRLVEVQGKGI